MRISPLRQRLIGDMTARHFGEKTQKDYIRCVVRSAAAFNTNNESLARKPSTFKNADALTGDLSNDR
jgi:hypothetical protein